MFNKFKLVGMFLFSVLCWSSAFSAPSSLNYQGRIIKSDGTPLEYNNVSFLFQVTDPSGSCVIYQEQVTGYSMVNSGGVFDVAIGNGTVQYPLAPSNVLNAFNNSNTFTCGSCSLVGSSYTCVDGSSTYPAGASDLRKLRVSFYDGSGWKSISPDTTIRSVPFAGYSLSAQKLGTNTASDFVLKANINSNTSCSGGSFLTWDATTQTFGCSTVSGASGGTVTNVSSGNSYLTIVNNASTPILTLNVGATANTVASGNDPRLVNAIQSGSSASGDLSGSYPGPRVVSLQGVGVSSTTPTSGQFMKFNGTIWGAATIGTSDISGLNASLSSYLTQSAFNGYVSSAGCSVSQTMYWNSVSGNFQCQAINVGLAGDVTGSIGAAKVVALQNNPVDTTAPANNQVLQWNGSKWTPATLPAGNSGTVTSVSGSAPLSVATGTSTPVISISQATTSTNGYLSSADWNTFNSKQAAGAYVTALTGDVTASGPGSAAATVAKLQGSTLTITTPASGDYVRYNGSAFVNSPLSANDLSGNIPAANMPAFTGDVTSSAGSTALTLASAGTAGTYYKVTTDSKGRVTSGVASLVAADIPNLDWSKITSGKPTTLSGYGITDSLVKNGGGVSTITAGADASKPGSPIAGDLFVATDTQKIYRYNGSSWDLVSSAGGSGGTVTNIATGTGLSGGPITGTGTISLANTAVTAGSYGSATQVPTITVDAQGRLTAASNTSIAIPWSAITSGAPTTLAGYGITDSVKNLGGSPGVQTGTDASKPAAPSAGTIYFATDTLKIYQYNSGAWSMIASATGSGGTVTSVTSANTDIAVATTTSTPVLTLNSGTGANQIVKLDGASKLPAVDGSALTNLNASALASGTVSTSVLPTIPLTKGGTGLTAGTSGGIPYFDSSSTMASSLALTANGVVLGGGAGAAPVATSAGTAYQPLRVPAGGGAPAFGAIDISQSAAVTGTLPIANGGTGASSLAANRLVGTDGTGTVQQAVTCAINQILSFDASGNYGCYAVSSIYSGFVNGGNSFGAASSLGNSDNFDLSIKTNNLTRITVQAGGNVGIGTTSPGGALDIIDGQGRITTGNVTVGAGPTTATAPTLTFSSTNNSVGPSSWNGNTRFTYDNNGFVISHNGSTGAQSAPPGFGLGTGGRNADIFIDGTGNVGIGTTSPGAKLEIDGSSGTTLKIVDGNQALNKVLTSDANGVASWASLPAGNAGTVTSVATGTGLSGGTVTSSGTISLANTAVTAAAYGSATQVPTFTVDAQGRLTAAANVTISGVAPGGAAGGDLSGTYPNPTLNTVTVAKGGTGLTAGTSGGIPYFDSSSTMASSPALTANGVVLGGGTGASPTATSAGTAYQPLRVPAGGGAPTFGAIDISQSAAVTGTLPIANGGTGASSLASNRLIGTNGTGTVQQAVTCAINQILSFDASGNYGCYAVSSIYSGFVNGGNTFGAASSLGNNDNFDLNIKTNNLTRMTVQAGGNVGIGTTTPAGILDVQGGTSASGAGLPINLIAQNALAGTSSAGGAIQITGGNSSKITSGGLLGGAVTITGGQGAYVSGPITAGRGGPVTVKGGQGAATIMGGSVTVQGGAGGSTSGAGGNASLMGGTATSGSGGSVSVLGGSPTEGAGGVVSVVGGNGASITSSNWAGGNVAIAGGAPVGTAAAGSVQINGGAGNGSTSNTGGTVAINGGYDNISAYSAVAMQTSGGNVGIGTTTPGFPLQIEMPSAANGVNSNVFNAGVGTDATLGSLKFQIWGNPSATGSSRYMGIVAADGAAVRNLVLNMASNGASGNVGIGTTSPGFTLDVNGSIAAVGALQAHSDRRLKKNIVNVDSPLEKLQAINGVYFDWRKDEFPKIKFEGGRQLGVIAQEVEKVFPEAVAVNKDGIRSVAYTMLIAPLVEAVKELHSKFLGHDEQLATQARQIASVQAQKADKAAVDAVKAESDAKIKKLEAENAELKARLEKIERTLNSK